MQLAPSARIDDYEGDTQVLPFPVPPPPPATMARAQSSWAFPPPDFARSAPTQRTRTPRTVFEVPAWVPVPLEAFGYFFVGLVIGALGMLLVTTALDARGPAVRDSDVPVMNAR